MGISEAQAEDTLDLTVLSRRLAANARHPPQYSLIVFYDAININVKVNWGNLRHTIHHLHPMTVRQKGVLDWHGCDQQRVTLHAVATTVYSRSDKDPDTKIKLMSVQLDNST